MIATFVTFQLDDTFDAELLSKIADESQSIFVGLPKLRNKVFTIDDTNRRVVNVYVWESEDAARAFFTDGLIERVTNLYGVKPQLDFAEVAALVDNSK